MIIDGTKSLTSDLISKFSKEVNYEEVIQFMQNDTLVKETTKTTLANDILTISIDESQIKDDDIFSLVSTNVSLTFNGADYKWWKKTNKRIEKFYLLLNPRNEEVKVTKKEKTKNKPILDEQTYSVAVAFCIDNFLSDIQFFVGPKSEAIEFINNDIFKKLSSTSIDTKVVINLAFDVDEFKRIFSEETPKEEKDEYRRNIEMWYTLRELEDIGALKLK